MEPPTGGPGQRRSRDSRVVVGKLFASIVIVVCLGAQLLAAFRPDDARMYPFLSYPMYSRSRAPGDTILVRDLWARACDDGQRSWKVDPRELGYQDLHSIGEFSAIARDRPGALAQRTRLSDLARTRLAPRPCVLELRERAVPTTRGGVDLPALRDVRGILLREWSVDDPSTVRAFSAR